MAKNEAAASLARERWKNTTDAERSDYARMMNEAKMDAIPAKRRSAIAKKAAQARWGKKKAAVKKKAKQAAGDSKSSR